jgi:hypothetical protein
MSVSQKVSFPLRMRRLARVKIDDKVRAALATVRLSSATVTFRSIPSVLMTSGVPISRAMKTRVSRPRSSMSATSRCL